MACYWSSTLDTNNLQATLEELLQFDLIRHQPHRQETPAPPPDVQFSTADREALRKLVDMGGTVWLDDCWLMRIDKENPGNAFFVDMNFAGTSLTGFNGRPKFSAIVKTRTTRS